MKEQEFKIYQSIISMTFQLGSPTTYEIEKGYRTERKKEIEWTRGNESAKRLADDIGSLDEIEGLGLPARTYSWLGTDGGHAYYFHFGSQRGFRIPISAIERGMSWSDSMGIPKYVTITR